jgi:hypothetical protein
MTKFYFILYLSFIGFVISPSTFYACGSNTKAPKECNIGIEEKALRTNSCCDKHNKQCSKHGEGCKGTCGDPACQCVNYSTDMNTLLFDLNTYMKSTIGYQNFFFKESYNSCEYFSIRLRPKIG